MANDKVEQYLSKIETLQQNSQDIFPYELRTGPLPKEKKPTVIAVCDCPQVCVV